MLPAPSHLDYETWKDQIRQMGARFDPKGDPKTLTGWVRPTSVSGLMAAEVGSNAHRVERMDRDVRVDGADRRCHTLPREGHERSTPTDS
jgi:AraC family transcriptional activator of tynA and feaB